MKLLPTVLLVLTCCGLVCQGKRKHGKDVHRKKSLAGLFKDMNNTDSKSDRHQKNKKSHGQHNQNSTVKISSVSNHPQKDLLHVSQATLSKASSKSESLHKPNSQNSNMDKKLIRQLLCKLFNLSKSHSSCKGNVHSKKAMIWPTKMIPWLKRILMNKLNGGEVNPVSYFNNMEVDATGAPFREGALNNMMDNWDSNFPFMRANRKHHHGLKMVPLLKMLKAKLRGENSSPLEFGTLNDALNGEGYNGFGPVPTPSSARLVQQILGQTLANSDRNAVLNEMIQEFLLANNQDHQASEINEPFSELTGRNNLAQLNNGLQGPVIIQQPSQGIGFRQLDGINMLQGNMRTPVMSPEEPIHAQMLDNGEIAPMPRQPLGASMMKNEPILGESPIGRSPLLEGTLKAPYMRSSLLSSPAISNSQIQSSYFEESPREESLLQKAGGFDVPILPSSQRTGNPTQRMYTESAGRQQISEGELDALARNQASESRISGSRGRGGNMILEEISEGLARGTRPTRFNPLVDAHSNLGESERPSYSTLSRLESNSFQHGLRLPVGSNTLGIASLLSKGQDALTLNSLPNQRSWAFRRGKVSKGTLKSHLQSKNSTAIPSPKHVQSSIWTLKKVSSEVKHF